MHTSARGLGVAALAGLLLLGCSGKTGPTGPSGAGSQTVHKLTVTPSAPDAAYEIAASEITVDPNCDCSSTVNCYCFLSSQPGVEYAMPTTIAESDNTTTYYTYQVRTGKVTVRWTNSGSTVPNVSTFLVTVINK